MSTGGTTSNGNADLVLKCANLKWNDFLLVPIGYGTAAPSENPYRIGQLFVDTQNKKAYISVGYAISDWVALN